MEEKQTERTVDRRRLLRRAGTVAAGVAGAGVAGAVVATPAQAADGQNLIIGQNNTGTETTKLTAGSPEKSAVRFENPAGAALSVAPTFPNLEAQAGSIYVDPFGDLATVSVDAIGPYVTYAYSPNWAKMPEPLVTPVRALYTRYSTTRTRVLNPGVLDSAGRLRAGQTLNLNLSDLAFLADGVMATVAAIEPTAAGYLTVFPYGQPRPNTANVGFEGLRNANSFVFVGAGFGLINGELDPNRTTVISIFASVATYVIVDVFGFVVRVPEQVLANPAAASITSQSTEGASLEDARRAALRKRLPELRNR